MISLDRGVDNSNKEDKIFRLKLYQNLKRLPKGLKKKYNTTLEMYVKLVMEQSVNQEQHLKNVQLVMDEDI